MENIHYNEEGYWEYFSTTFGEYESIIYYYEKSIYG